ncbi:MAG: DUF1549 domain-containing protein [Chthoniobacteraceae bacterium]
MNSFLSVQSWPAWLRNGFIVALLAGGAAIELRSLLSPPVVAKVAVEPAADGVRDTTRAVDAAFGVDWQKNNLTPAPAADALAVVRRLSLALTGSIPSLQEIRAIEAQPESERVGWWLAHLLADRRSDDYLAERLARVFVGTEQGPFIVYRRRRLVDWLAEELRAKRPYDQIVRSLIDAQGIWTTNPEVNFVTAAVEPNKGPSEEKLAAKVSRAFLGVQMDCVQCHDGKLDSTWKQRDFHQLAAFFGQSNFSLVGLRDDPKQKYEYRYLRKSDEEVVPTVVPWQSELLPEQGAPRQRLAQWVTSPENKPFARAFVNRMWAFMFNRPLVLPIDEIPLHGPFPPGLEILAEDFAAHGFDVQRLIRVIAGTRVFQMRSESADPDHPPGDEAEKHWAAFPMTRLRPDQMAGSVIQAASLSTIDADTQVIFRLKRDADVSNFVKRYGDVGEDEFGDQSGTITQRLLMMNGSMISSNTGTNFLTTASARISMLSPDPAAAVETAYLAVFTRRPSAEEADYFTGKLAQARENKSRSSVMSDLYWTLLNSTEFAWSH